MLKTMMSKKVSMHLITLKICFNLQKNHGEKSTQRAQFTLLSFIIRCISICLWRNLLNTINFFFNFSKDFLTKLELIWSILKKVHWVFLSLVIRFCTIVILLNCQKKQNFYHSHNHILNLIPDMSFFILRMNDRKQRVHFMVRLMTISR